MLRFQKLFQRSGYEVHPDENHPKLVVCRYFFLFLRCVFEVPCWFSGCNDELVNYSDLHTVDISASSSCRVHPKDLETVNIMLRDQLATGRVV